MKISRRELVNVAIPALAADVMLPSGVGRAGDVPSHLFEPELGEPWPQQRKKIERAWLDLLGDFPAEIPALRPIVKKVADEGGITRYHVSYQSEADDRVTAWLMVPNSAKGKRTAAMICIYSTTYGSGKDYTVGLAGRRPGDPPCSGAEGHQSGLFWAQYGYITLSMDFLTDGERVEPGARVLDTRGFYKKHPEWSMVGKNIWDIMRGVDFLQSLDFVDAQHIGVQGLSFGGHMALFAGAFEPRISATVADGGVLDWHRNTDSWARADQPNERELTELARRFGYKELNVGPYIYIKRFRPYIEDPNKPIPVDFDSLMMMVAPRPLLILSTEQEFYGHKILPKIVKALPIYMNWRDTEGMPSIMGLRRASFGHSTELKYYKDEYNIQPDAIERHVAELGAGDCFSWFSFAGGHSFPSRVRRYSFAWADRWLGHEPDASLPGVSWGACHPED